MSQTQCIFVIFLAVMLVNWIAAARLQMRLYHATKPFVLLLLLIWFIAKAGVEYPVYFFVVALVFSLFGDITLISQRRYAIFVGMAFFAVAHAFYIAGFYQWKGNWDLLGSLLILVATICLTLVVFPGLLAPRTRLSKTFKKWAVGYAFFLLMLVVSSVASFWRDGWSVPAATMASCGAVLFLASDVMIGLEKARVLDKRVRFWVISSYHVAQFLIVSSVLITTKSLVLWA